MRLVTFLGIGPYESIRYTHPEGRGVEPRYVAHAIARLWEADEVVVLATDEAEKAHGTGLRKALAAHPDPEQRRILSGRTEAELWRQFEVLGGALEGEGGLILISPRARCIWESAVDELLMQPGGAPTALGPMVVEILADGSAVLYRVGPGGATVSLPIGEDDWRPRLLV
jgi:hypothetical protein